MTVKLYDTGVYLVRGREVTADGPEALQKIKAETGKETSREEALRETMAYRILESHNVSGNMEQLQIKFDRLTSHDITL